MAERDWDSMTRTEQGYAFWKEDPKTVHQARLIAASNIGLAQIRQALLWSWAEPLVDWLNNLLTRATR